MSPASVVLYASYPKTGSTMLADVLGRLAVEDSRVRVEKFVHLGGKNNFRIQREPAQESTLILKTHASLGDWLSATWKQRAQESTLVAELRAHGFCEQDAFEGTWLRVIYLVRNPFNTLISALRYIKLLTLRPGVLEIWRADGRAERLFAGLLGLRNQPTAEEFQKFTLLELPDAELEALLWRYLDAGGTIPAFEEEGRPTYFAHVNYFIRLIDSGVEGIVLDYESLMARDRCSINAIASVIQIDGGMLFNAWQSEFEQRVFRKQPADSFYGDFNIRTPRRITQLPSWKEMQQQVAIACPRLAALCT